MRRSHILLNVKYEKDSEILGKRIEHDFEASGTGGGMYTTNTYLGFRMVLHMSSSAQNLGNLRNVSELIPMM